ncbi:MAG: MerR family transcriptional regulator [Clostridiales bacterium]|jgi:flagellar operon protein (TIGR03826 family)|nr:MerR family transcriptional regulator [Clostridiales bacterium]
MMEMRNCPKCKRVFNYISSPICPDCEKEEELVFDSVVDYVKNNPESNLAKVSQETGVSAKKLLRYVKEGRLEISKGMHGEIRCEKCGAPILKGRYCDTCVIAVNQQIDEMFETKKQDTIKMHVMDRIKHRN